MAHLQINGADLYGVYYHSAERAHLCQGTYMHYIGFGGGWFVAPLVVVDAVIQCEWPDGTFRSSSASRSKKSMKQFITYEGQHQLVGVILHVVHASQLFHMPKACGIAAEPVWVPELELDPNESWEVIQERSSSMRYVPPGY